MKLDGNIGNSWALLGLVIALGIGGFVYSQRKNPRPPQSRFRKDGGIPLIAPWNLFNEEQLTPEAITYHRRTIRGIPVFLALFLFGWLLLDLLW